MKVIITNLNNDGGLVHKEFNDVLKVEPGARGVSFWKKNESGKDYMFWVSYKSSVDVCILP